MTRLIAADFGIVGDGITDSTDGFLTLHAHLLSDRERMWQVQFSPGHYLTRASHWLINVGRVTLIGYGASLQHMVANKGLFTPSEVFRHLVSREPFPAPQVFEHHPGFRIKTAEAGSFIVEFLSGVRPEQVQAGDAVLIAGYNQQTTNEDPPRSAGWPPNHRFAEFLEVQEVGDSFVRLLRPLRHGYDERWIDYDGDYFGPVQFGAPRLFLANRPGFDIPRHIEMRGFRFLRSIGATSVNGVGFPCALTLVLEDCVIQEIDPVGGSFVQMADRVVLRRCAFDGLEVDKNLRHVLLEDCDIGERGLTSDGAGCEVLELRNTRLHSICRINPRTVIAENVTAQRNFQLNAAHGGYYDTLPFTVTTRATRP